MELKQGQRLILVKIVYYGPAVGGKTTNLQMLHDGAQLDRRGDLVSINSAQDRTILFDLLPIRATGFRGYELRVQLMAVPGQAMYAATRKLVLRGADGVVFVANSAADRWDENVKSYQEMTKNLLAHHLDPATLPMVLQYNKRDLPALTPIDTMERTLNPRKVPSIPAVVIRGEGVLETFSAALCRTMQDLSSRYKLLALQQGQSVEDWTRQMVMGVFGRPTLAQREPEPEEPEEEELPPISGVGDELSDLIEIMAPAAQQPTVQRSVRVTLSPEAVSQAGSGPDARANESLVESYAQASADLTLTLEDVRSERDQARRQVDDLRHTMAAVHALLSGHPIDTALRVVLIRMAQATDCRVASIVARQPSGELRTVTGLGVARDLFLTHPDGTALVERLGAEPIPRVHQVADDPALADVLAVATPPFAAVLVVPFLASELQGLALLYFTSDAALPPAATLEHLAALTRPVAAAWRRAEAASAAPPPLPKTPEPEPAAADGELLNAAVTGLAATRGLEELGAALDPVWERLQSVGLHSQTPPVIGAEIAQAAGGLVRIATSIRSLTDFAAGQTRPATAVVAEVLSTLRGQGVRTRIDPAVETLEADPTLLRVALECLVDAARKAGCSPDQMALAVSGNDEKARFDLQAPATLGHGNARLEEGLARRIAELHGGRLVSGHQPGLTRFALLLPR
jgi:signal recognition particle receptor subunit beta